MVNVKNKGQNRTSKRAPAPIGKKSGRKLGHVGVTRKNNADSIVRINLPSKCKNCGSISMKAGKTKNKMVVDVEITSVKRTNYVFQECREAVIDMLLPTKNIPVIADGYALYNVFDFLQRCWAHILREAEHSARDNRQLHAIYMYLKRLYHMAKEVAKKGEFNADLAKKLENVVIAICKRITNEGDVFGGKLERAAPNLFTFLRHPGMEPTNNVA